MEYGEDYQLPLPTISDGNIFLGWELATEIESTMMTDSEGKSLTKCDFNESIVLLPVWKQGKVVISFDSSKISSKCLFYALLRSFSRSVTQFVTQIT